MAGLFVKAIHIAELSLMALRLNQLCFSSVPEYFSSFPEYFFKFSRVLHAYFRVVLVFCIF